MAPSAPRVGGGRPTPTRMGRSLNLSPARAGATPWPGVAHAHRSDVGLVFLLALIVLVLVLGLGLVGLRLVVVRRLEVGLFRHVVLEGGIRKVHLTRSVVVG